MKGYCLFDNVEVHDLAKLEMYKEKVAPLVAKYEGTYAVLGGRFRVVEGTWAPTYLVMIEFPSYEKAEAWYFSEAYAQVKALRHDAAMANGVIIEGV
ncbi:MAG TPA: DUF1330 domain-containing protein [Cytophagales bacterium]|nr:DUF1330 domain-containing protein [Cytophagales bacterium]